MKDKKIPYLIEPNLTPENAVEKGYRYVGDVPDLTRIIHEVFQVAGKNGYVFGIATKEGKRIGLYKREE